MLLQMQQLHQQAEHTAQVVQRQADQNRQLAAQLEQLRAHNAALQQSHAASSSAPAPLQPSVASVSVAAQSVASSHAPRPPRPGTFDGVRMSTNAHIWLAELDQYVAAARVSTDQRLELAGSFLRSSALLAWNQARLAAIDADGQPTLTTWEQFRAWFLSRYQPFAAAKSARMALYSIRQRPNCPVAEYTNAFMRLVVLIPDMAMTDQIEHYLRGLCVRDVAAEVDRRNPATLTEAMDTAAQEEMRLASNTRRFGTSQRAWPGASQHVAVGCGRSLLLLLASVGADGPQLLRPRRRSRSSTSPWPMRTIRRLRASRTLPWPRSPPTAVRTSSARSRVEAD